MHTLHISPKHLTVAVVDDVPVVQAYRATLTGDDGSERDVTAETRFELADRRIGSWEGERLSITGHGAGPTEIVAFAGGVKTTAELTVFIRGTRVEGAAPGNAPTLFANAVASPTCAPRIEYPADKLLVPANLGELDVHWTDARNDLFEIAVSNEYVDLRVYTVGRDPDVRFWSGLQRNEWSQLVFNRQPMELTVTGLSTASPIIKCETTPQELEVTREDALGGVYYWSTDWAAREAGENGQEIMRFDLRTPEVAPSPLFTGSDRPATCIGCHALSRDGSRVAITLDGATGAGSVIDLTDGREMMPTGTAALHWSSAAFSADATKLLAVQDGTMRLLETDGGALLTTLTNTPGQIASNPEFSPDGTMLASVETSGTTDWAFGTASVVVRTFDATTSTFGDARMLMPFDATQDMQSYYPSWSPDGKWIAITRSSGGNSYNNPDATVWVIKVDGSQPAVAITPTAGLTDSMARWLPFESETSTFEPVYFLSFSSERAFGTRLPYGGRPQIWLTPFYPDRAGTALEPAGQPFRAPFQDASASNHAAQWTTGVVLR